jgi:hypothetical protein
MGSQFCSCKDCLPDKHATLLAAAALVLRLRFWGSKRCMTDLQACSCTDKPSHLERFKGVTRR